uniref:MuF-C-terminal domain-containing protein n=1 Tax=uncultured Desulfovibrio sp. TaxID=167968 RepID=UPI00262B8CDF
EDIEAVLVHRGPAVMRDGQIVVQGRALQRETGSKSGYGLVKIIFAHGEGGNKTPGIPAVTREDVISLPRLLRDFESRIEGDHRVWRIPREDGFALRIVTRHGEEEAGARLVSMYVGPLKEGEAFSRRKPPVASSASSSSRNEDTGRGIDVSHPAGEQGAGHMTDSSLPDGAESVKPFAPDYSPAAEAPALPVEAWETPEAARLAEMEELAGQDEALHQAALYEQTPLGETARASLERDIRDFGTAVDGIVAAGKLPSSPVKMLGQTPLVMRLLGRDTVTGKAAAQGGVYAAPHVFDGTHPNMTPEMWKQIPGALADPVAVFDSDSPAGRSRGDLVFMLELTDADGATVVVPVALDASKGRNQAHVNIVKSAYAKESGGVPANKWFLRQLKKNARYVNGQKMKPWLRAAGADSPLGSWKDLAAANASGNRIYTDADLVKLREAHPKLYQSEASGDSPALRAQVTLDAETAAIRIFKGADLSSIPHESAHLFVDDLRRVAADDGSMARERLRSEIEQAGMDGTPFAGILSGEVDVEMARAMLRDAREELAMLDDSDAGLRAAEKVPAKSESSKEGREEIRAALKTNAARRRELLPVERRLSAYVRHLDGLEQAKRDMATLRRFAGVAEDGELTDARSGEAAGRHPRRAHRSAGHGTDHHGGGQTAGRRRKADGAGTGDPACRCGGHPQGARFRRARHPAAAYPRF